MTNHTINFDRTLQLHITTDNDGWTLNEGVELYVYGKQAILLDKGADNNTVNILGRVLNTGTNNYAVDDRGDHNTFYIGKDAQIDALAGISSVGIDPTITNDGGEINGSLWGIDVSKAATITNSGRILGASAIELSADYGKPDWLPASGTADPHKVTVPVLGHNVITNEAGGEILGGERGILIRGGATHEIVNDGLIAGHIAAVQVNYGVAHIVNRGTMDGGIFLGAGNDVVDTRQGIVHGVISSGAGNDTYILGNNPTTVHEIEDYGFDTVKSTASYVLGDNFERLILLGKGNSNGTGSVDDNIIVGTIGKNTLKGMGGDDSLSGGKGNDILTGGGDADTFVFHKGDGKDTVTDFEDGSDHVQLANIDGIQSFSALSSHISQHGNDIWLSFGSDRVILADTNMAEIDKTDFSF